MHISAFFIYFVTMHPNYHCTVGLSKYSVAQMRNKKVRVQCAVTLKSHPVLPVELSQKKNIEDVHATGKPR